ncbi:MAG: hypothetical protein EBR49_04000 [Betaproteobacteria bacterium]|nr:hypothetical protein [Betaproteobacteria bacterium]
MPDTGLANGDTTSLVLKSTRNDIASDQSTRTKNGSITKPVTAKRRKVMSEASMPWLIPQRAKTV